ncbi:MAG: helix-turn-helix domain-containing protein [Clostridia bacterium]|nr:helix-turn-helix domain-containing protein [Clostridia bacterium]
MDNERKPGYWAVLPARVRYDEELRPNAKLLYAEISAMSDSTGFCWATNGYLAKLFGLEKDSIARLVTQLAARGYITVEVLRDERNTVTERRIWLREICVVDTPPPGKISGRGPGKISDTLPDKNPGHRTEREEQEIPPYSPPKGGRRDRVHKDAPDWEPERFKKLWLWYPHDKRGNKQRAIRAWDALHPDRALIDTMATALDNQSRTDEWERGVGIPHLSTYLNSYGWEGWTEPEVRPRRSFAPQAERRDLEWI